MGILTITAPGTFFNGITVSSGTGAANLRTPDPKEVWVAATASAVCTYDFGSAQPVDSVFLGFTNLKPGSFWELTTSVDGNDFITRLTLPIIEPIAVPGFDGSVGRRVHIYARLPAPVVARYVRLGIAQPDGSPNLTAGIFVANQCFQPVWPQELGGGRMPIDTAQRERLPGGGFSFDEGIIKDTFQLTLGDLTDAEVATLYALVRRRGERGPVVLVEDPDYTAGLNERIRWGVLDRLEAYERRGAGITRWSLRVEDWAG